MVGVVVAAHGRYAEALVETAEGIVGKLERVAVVNLLPSEGLSLGQEKVRGAIAAVDAGAGVLLLVDFFGGTPCNCCLAQLDRGQLEVITGVNLPMLLRLPSLRERGLSLRELAENLTQHGQQALMLASDVLRARLPAAR